MDLLEHMFDKNPWSHDLWAMIKRNDREAIHLTVALAQDPRNHQQSITAAADINELGRDIGANTRLEKLYLDDLYCIDANDVPFSYWMFGALCQGIHANKSIEELTVSNFSHNQWAIGQFLGPFLAGNPKLGSVIVMTGGGPTATPENMRLLVTPLLDRTGPLTELAFIENGVNDPMTVALVDVFLKNPSLTPVKLEVAACEVGDVGCLAISKLLARSECTMEVLDLVQNYITDKGAASLACGLKRNGTLRKLHLAGNQISDKGWRAFSGTTGICEVTNDMETGDSD